MTPPQLSYSRHNQETKSQGCRAQLWPVLPALGIIYQKKEKFVNRAGKRQRDPLSKAETLTAGQLQKAAELKEDQSILLHIKDKDCVALEVQNHKGCYNQYTRFLTRPEKPEKDQNEPTFDVSYKIFCERIIRQRLLVNQEVLRMGQLRKAFIELGKANEGLDASNYRQDMLRKRLARDFPQLVFHIPTKRNICELVFAETLSTGTLVDMLPYPSGAETTQSSELSQTDSETEKGTTKMQTLQQWAKTSACT
ncbi:uncharacterized protein LOC130198366 [Pseudoliparis swirei]|uniref:uncharacterized protein LOC130198366 n=1 Tax=Pseudoliparis swirei TaxID=2059687 RepID=UPI0024BD709B|nr:uncharacterized protein LOC130198366 [Pseudoliparis swirei]